MKPAGLMALAVDNGSLECGLWYATNWPIGSCSCVRDMTLAFAPANPLIINSLDAQSGWSLTTHFLNDFDKFEVWLCR